MDPEKVRKVIHGYDMEDVEAEDGVTYPGIVDLEGSVVADAVHRRLGELWPNFKPTKTFARYSMEQMKPPNWAHSDKDMTQMVALIYLSGKDKNSKTYLLEHESGYHLTPSTMVGKTEMMEDSNNTFKWRPWQTLEGKNNSCWVLNADFIHAAGVSYGRHKNSARLVITCFFDI